MPTTLATSPIRAKKDFAHDIFRRGTNFLDLELVRQVFKEVGNPIMHAGLPFSEDELSRAHELNQALVLYPVMTMKGVADALGNELSDCGKLLYNRTDWYKDEPFFVEDLIVPEPTYKLVSLDVIPGSRNVNYLGQTEAIVNYLIGQVYKDQELPTQYQEAVDEFNAHKHELATLMNTDWQAAAEQLTNLQINQLFRETPGEVICRIALYEAVNHQRLLEDMYTWTKSRSSSGSFVFVGSADRRGADVRISEPGDWNSNLGVCFSRSGLLET